MHAILRSSLSILLTGAILLLGPASTVRAGAVTTGTLGASAAELQGTDRDALAAELVRLGVDPSEAQRRVDALSPEEVTVLQGRLDQLPAGGFVGAIVGAALIVFLVLLVTDIAGLTDVFSFVKKPVRR